MQVSKINLKNEILNVLNIELKKKKIPLFSFYLLYIIKRHFFFFFLIFLHCNIYQCGIYYDILNFQIPYTNSPARNLVHFLQEKFFKVSMILLKCILYRALPILSMCVDIDVIKNAKVMYLDRNLEVSGIGVTFEEYLP